MLVQGYCLIKAIVKRRITLMRQRDILEETGQPAQLAEEDEDGNFMNGIFGGLVQVPLPIPEILSTLDRAKYKEIIQERVARRKQSSNFDTVSEQGGFKQCPICWSDFKRHHMVTALQCNDKHLYHSACIESWIRKGNNSCPLCRQSIAEM